LDKDGTLVNDVPYNVDPELITLSPNAAAGLRLFSQLGYLLLVVSNQSGVAHGHFRESALDRVWQRLDQLLAQEGIQIDGYYYCPHHPAGAVGKYARACDCRKPQPGMLLQAAAEHGVNLAASWMIGDILHDMEAGKRAGCKTMLIDNGNETEWELSPLRMPNLMAVDLYAAAQQVAAAQSKAPHALVRQAPKPQPANWQSPSLHPSSMQSIALQQVRSSFISEAP
ncbi:MAG TPA: HAD family hydrolase, partial [Methylophilaceae bacterium]|nr:HAD family hydrolase [Methylophilaceae bacterium]